MRRAARRTLVLLAGAALLALPLARGSATPAETRSAFLKIVAPRPAGLVPDVLLLEDEEGLAREKAVILSEPGHRVAMLLYRRRDLLPPRPVVVVLHGTRGSKEGMAPWLREFARRGFLAVAPDARWHGERALGDYEEAIIRAYETGRGHPWLYETVTDTIRVLDYLQTRADVDRERIGLIGISMGGMNTWLTAAADPRVKVVVPCIGVTSFGYQVETGTHATRCATLPRFHRAVADALGEKEITPRVAREAWDRVLPGIRNRFDCPRMLEAIAPRPLLILNGERDDRCPLEGVRQCYTAAEHAYRAAGALDRLRMIIAPGTGHQVTEEQRQAAFAWFERWL